jgi:sirohydrochlorin cobaltochelatase
MMKLSRWIVLAGAAVAVLGSPPSVAAAPQDPAGAADPAGGFGILVMAHGGGPEWNRTVLDAVAPLRGKYPVEVAFGMADACSLQESVRKLEAQQVREIGVVRLFVSGESWYEETEKILALAPGAPAPAAGACAAGDTGHEGHEGHAGHGGHHGMAFFRVDSQAAFALSAEGLSDAPETGPILADRARTLSRMPEKEDVLILAHGPGDDAENQRWLAAIDARAAEVRASLPFHRVEVMTLREDWPDKRKNAEKRVVDFVARAQAEGRQAIVIPFRLSGCGPYAEVLAGQEYVADRRGLLPHVNITSWIGRQAEELRRRMGER